MVNVGGRSKGCSTCRKRRVKCDETHPVCKKCQKSDLPCDGPRSITFIEATIVKSRRNEKRTTVSKEHEAENMDSANYQILPSVSQRGNETEIYLCYTLNHLRGGPIDLALHESRSSEIATAGNTSATTQIFHQAVLSFAIVFFGTRHRQNYIVNNGYTMLGGTLRQLNQALSDSNCHTRDEIILSVVTLALLESFVPTGPNHYLQHMVGLERLIELRGPNAYRSQKSLQLFRGIRYMILFASLRTRTPSILARPEWKRLQRASCSEEAAQEQDIFDVIADCTVLLSDRDNMLALADYDSEGSQRERNKIARKALMLLTSLHSWRERWNGDSANFYFRKSAAFSTLNSTQESQLDQSFFPLTVFDFSNDSAATMLMFYNTALICVLQILISLTSDTFDPEPSQTPTINTFGEARDPVYNLQKQMNSEHLAAERLAALEICSCLPHLIRKSSLGSRTIHLAVTTAWTALGGDLTAEGRWIRNALNTPGREFIAKGLWVDDTDGHPDSLDDYGQKRFRVH